MSADFRRLAPAVSDRRYRNRAVCIFGRIESAFRRSHVAPDVIKNVTRGRGEFRIASYLKSVEIRARQLRLVVKHFLEMWHMPVRVDGIAMKSTANVIVYSTGRHLSQCQQDHFQGMLPGIRIRIARVEAHQKIKCDRAWKLWRATETALMRIKGPRELLVSGFQNAGIDFSGRRLVFGGFAQRIDNVRSLVRNFFAIVFPCFRDSLQNSLKSRLTKAVFRWKIGAADKRFEPWSKPYAHGPAAAARR